MSYLFYKYKNIFTVSLTIICLLHILGSSPNTDIKLKKYYQNQNYFNYREAVFEIITFNLIDS